MKTQEETEYLSNIANKDLFPTTTTISKDGHLIIGGCNTLELVKKYGSPLYVIDEETVNYKATEYINALKESYENFLILYAAKAFACKAIFILMNKLGLGFDIVSGGELSLALKSNVNKLYLYFHGNNKEEKEIEMAIRNDVGRIVCDNFYELELLDKIAKKENKTINLLIRLTPGIECHTHEYIKTGHLDSKFGFDQEHIDEVLNFIKHKSKNLILKGFHSHIGSQIFEVKPFIDTIDILLDWFQHSKIKYDIELNELDIGGGLGVSYIKEDDPVSINYWAKEISKAINKKCKKLNLKLPKLICEPGRSIISTSGITLYKVGSTKQVPNGRKYVSVDGGMADNPRPITYQAKYTAVVANKMNYQNKSGFETVTIAGRYCETGDLIIKDIKLPKLKAEDIIAVLNTGAYNYSMSSNYNLVPRPSCILVKEGRAEIIIESENYNDLISKHKIPSWLLD